MAGQKDLQGKGEPEAKAAAPEASEPARDPLHMERPLMVRLLGISDRTFARLEAEGVIATLQPRAGRKGGVYDAAAVVRAFLLRQERQIRETNESPQALMYRSQTELNQLRIDEKRRLVLPRDQVVQEGQAYVNAVTAKLRSIPPRLVQAGLVPAAQGQAAEDMIEEAISEMAGWSTALELLKAVDEKAVDG